MRTIKFRGKRVDNGEWVYGDLVNSFEGIHISPSSYFKPSNDQHPELHEVNPSTVGEFTGLQDKNGKDIYEGDIVNSNSNYDNPYYREVVWGENCGLEFKPLSGITLCKSNENHFFIIGNIHDNSELLNQSL